MSFQRVVGSLTLIMIAGFAVILLSSLSASVAANDEIRWMSFPQVDPVTGLTKASINKRMRMYSDTTAANCYNGAAWCCKTTTGTQAQVSHDHLDTTFNADLNTTQQLYCHTWYGNVRAYATDANLRGPAAAAFNCHAAALGESVWVNDLTTFLTQDYDPVDEDKASTNSTVCEHTGDHSSLVTEVTSDCKVKKIVSKCGRLPSYETTPAEMVPPYGTISQHWNPKE